MFTRATAAAFLSLAMLATACSGGSSGGTPGAGGSSTPNLSATGSTSPGGTGSASPGATATASSGLTANGKPPNPLIAKINSHLDEEGRIIGPVIKVPRAKGVVLITRAFQQLRLAIALLKNGLPGVPRSFTNKFVTDLNAALSQEGRDKQCIRTRSKSLCPSVFAASRRDFSTILDDRNKLNTYNP